MGYDAKVKRCLSKQTFPLCWHGGIFLRCAKERSSSVKVVSRHAQTQANRDGILQGRTDTPISDIGVEQANEAAKKWKDISVDCVYCPPLLRARQTARLC